MIVVASHIEGVWKVQLGGHRGGRDAQGWALVDATDLDLIAPHKWSLVDGYATRGGHVAGVGHRMIRMHREILGLVHGDGVEVDHINRERIDNRRSNLRIVEHAENCQNVPAQIRGGRSTGLRGVRLLARHSRFQAYATVQGTFHHLGMHDTPEQAAEVARAFRMAAMAGAVD